MNKKLRSDINDAINKLSNLLIEAAGEQCENRNVFEVHWLITKSHNIRAMERAIEMRFGRA